MEIIASTAASPAVAVALFTRAWIEIYRAFTAVFSDVCRPLYEGVD